MAKKPFDDSRRTFLGNSIRGLAVAGLASAGVRGAKAGTPVSQTEQVQGSKILIPGPPQPKVGYAIVGLGKLALGEVLPAFVETLRCAPTALVSGDADKARAVAQHYNIPTQHIYDYKNFDKIKDNPHVDAVFIILPNAMHAEYTVRAAAAGKHVLCEKPMATTVSDCDRMIAACKSNNKKLMIAYRVHYEPFNQKMIEWSRQKKYGPIQFITADALLDIGGTPQWRLDPALSGGGSLVDIGIYALNATRYLTGEEPSEVAATYANFAGDNRFKHLEGGIAFQLGFPSGAVANCTSSYGSAKINRYTVVGAKGWYGLDPATSYRDQVLKHGHDEVVEELHLKPVNHFAAEMEHFADCIQNDKQPLTPGEEGRQDVKLMQLIYEAARSRTVVRVA